MKTSFFELPIGTRFIYNGEAKGPSEEFSMHEIIFEKIQADRAEMADIPFNKPAFDAIKKHNAKPNINVVLIYHPKVTGQGEIMVTPVGFKDNIIVKEEE